MSHQRRRPWWILPLGRVDERWWVLIIGVLTAVDYLGGPQGPFPVFYAIPVVLGAWYSGHIVTLSLETYLESRSGAEFSHGICPACAQRHFST